MTGPWSSPRNCQHPTIAWRQTAKRLSSSSSGAIAPGPSRFPGATSRVLIPERQPLGREAQRTLSAAGVPVARSDIYDDERDLLRSWRRLVSSLEDFRRTVDLAVAGKIEASFRDLLAFEASVGTLTVPPTSSHRTSKPTIFTA